MTTETEVLHDDANLILNADSLAGIVTKGTHEALRVLLQHLDNMRRPGAAALTADMLLHGGGGDCLILSLHLRQASTKEVLRRFGPMGQA